MSSSPAAAASSLEEYQIWKKNTPYLYDFLLSHALEWPSLTVQFIPTNVQQKVTNTLSLLLGTHTSSDSEPNHLLLTHIPSPSLSPSTLPSLTISKKALHDGEVNRARFMPERTNVVATKTPKSEVHLFDFDAEVDELNAPFAVLKGHDESEGYGLDWSALKEGWILSGGYDSKICLWDVGVGAKVLDAKQVFEAHTSAVEDVAWHLSNENLFGSVADDHMLMIWDLRTLKPQHSTIAHEDEVNSISFNQFNENILATGSADSTVNLFDLRKLDSCLHTFSSHTEAVRQVEWSPDYETILASSADDKRVMIWDLCRIGDEQSEEDAEDGPPELLFAHGGHTDKISEFSWSPNEPWMIASVAEDNILQIWQVADSIYRDDYSLESEGDIYAAT